MNKTPLLFLSTCLALCNNIMASELSDSFSNNYFEARERLIRTLAKAERLETPLLRQPETQSLIAPITYIHEQKQIEALGPNGTELYIDFIQFYRTTSTTPRKHVMISISGTHGVEAFAGSAIQLHSMLKFLNHPELIPLDTTVVFVHALNPFGFAHKRRWNENNIDLNRNFVPDGNYHIENQVYPILHPKLVPAEPKLDRVERAKTFKNSFLKVFADNFICRLKCFGTFAFLKQGLAQGQYEFPNGLFYGGDRPTESTTLLNTWLEHTIPKAELKSLSVIDIHTGLGKSGIDTLIVAEESDRSKVSHLFKDRVVQSANSAGVSYHVEGLAIARFRSMFPGTNQFIMAEEFGTYKPLVVVEKLVNENIVTQSPGLQAQIPEAREELKEVFCPNQLAWKESVVIRGTDTFFRTLSRSN